MFREMRPAAALARIAAPENFATRFVLLALSIGAAYSIAYYVNPWRPGALASNPDGWFTSWDQTNYRQSAQALSEFALATRRHFYPVLFPWLGAPFVRWMPNHAFLIPSIACLLVHLYGVARIGERYFGPAITYGVLALLFLGFPRISLEQYVYPWTSSLVAALSSVLFVIFVRLVTKPTPWAIETRADHAMLYGFYLAYGAVFATRPLDVLILFPLAVIVAVGVLWRLGMTARTIGVALGIGAAGWLFPAMQFGVNYLAWGSVDSFYLWASRNAVGFASGWELVERAVSLWIDPDAIYPGTGPALSDYFPLFIPALLVCIIAVFRAPFVVRVLAGIAVLQILTYTSYRDLNPHNLFGANVVHYFKWAWPWLLMIAAWQTVQLIRARAWLPLAAVSLISVLILSVRLDITPIAATTSVDQGGTVTITAPETPRINVVDMPLSGGFVGGASQHTIVVDGVEIKRNPNFPGYTPNVKGLGTPWGTRLAFMQAVDARSIVVTFPPPFQVASDRAPTIGQYRYTLWCALPRCVSR